jgi:hypothetical protein
VVLPTRGGKTLLFTTVAYLDDPGMIIVVIPYRRLIDETVNNTRALRIDCSEWTYRTEDPATIVFVRTTSKSHAQLTAEKRGDLKKDRNHVFEYSAPNSTSYYTNIISLDSLHSILYSYIAYTSYRLTINA